MYQKAYYSLGTRQVKVDLEMLVFAVRGKPEYAEKNHSGQGKQQQKCYLGIITHSSSCLANLVIIGKS